VDKQVTLHNTFVVEKSYPKPLATVFQAFTDPAIKRRWYAESRQHDVELFESDCRVGGVERFSYRLGKGTPFEGVIMAAEGSHTDVIPHQRIVQQSTMSFGNKRISSALVTFEFVPTAKGTDLICTHQAAFFEGADGPEMRKHGWNALFERLAAELGA
jgi:uncharacterized protein YndB with AHSA1/START domain